MQIFKTFLLSTLLIFLISAALQPFLPWWTLAIVAAGVSLLFKLKSYLNFFAGFIGIGLLWAGYAWWLDRGNASILSLQIGEIFNGLSPELLVFSTGILGGLVGGFAALTAGLLRNLVFEKK